MRLRGSFALGLGFILLGGPGVPSCSGWPPGHTAGRIKEVGMAEPHSDRSWLQPPPPARMCLKKSIQQTGHTTWEYPKIGEPNIVP